MPMVQIFISYSRVDLVFVEHLYKRLQQMRPSIAVWYDKAPHGLLGGDKWWDSILDAIEASDIFIYVLSNDSVQSPYCQAEFQEARRLVKQIITIQARDRTRIEGELAEIQFVDMKNGVDDPEALVSLSGALERQLALAKRLRPLTFQRTPKPTDDGARARQPEKPAASAPVSAAAAVSQTPQKAGWRDWRVLAAAALLLIAVVGLLPSLMDPDSDSNSMLRTAEPLYLSPTPPVGESEATLTAVAGQAQSVLQTATAEPQNRRATSEADSTLRAAAESATSVALAITQAVMTETATHIPFGGVGNPVTANADWSPVLQDFGGISMVKVPAGCFMMGSSDYTDAQIHQQCFEEPFWIGQTEVTNAQYQAFMDAGGYTNAAYWTAAGWAWQQGEGVTQPSCYTDSAFNQPDQPVVCVTWYEAQAYSAWLSAASGLTFRLPTEAEWEYAARGPEGLIYPWGNEWNADNVVWSDNSSGHPANVGSRPTGASWAGALDMSGNVWEWLSSQYQAYPYSATDGREDVDMQTDVLKVLRGGAWFNNNTDFLRCDYRSRYAPRYVLSGGGFRVVVSLDSARIVVTPLPSSEDSSTSTAPGNTDNPVTANVQWTPIVQELGGIPMVKVPAGCFMMGNNDGSDNEKPAHQQCFDVPFWIGQTEVTNAQYQAFIEAGGYTNAAYWTAAGWAWQQNEGITQPACWTDSRFNQPDQPVVCVSWYEAAAYSAWLSASSGQAFRLPTESEWEYAARGPDGWVYPWGNTWNADNAVTSETSSGQIAPVGSRPSGASWVGTLDMSGNVWEWVSSYPYSASDGREDLQDGARQVVRGGSWGSYSDFTRASFRYFFIPDFRDDYIGFRILRPLLGL